MTGGLLGNLIVVAAQEARSSLPTASDTSRFKVSGALRVRPEARQDVGFNPELDNSYVLSRLRVRLTANIARRAIAVVEVQDSRSPGLFQAPPTLRDPADVHQAYLDLGSKHDPVALRFGRQELVYGNERLVSRNNWRNTGRSFDAARLFLCATRWRVDVFGAAEVSRDPRRLNPYHDLGDIYGVYASFGRPRDNIKIESYVLRRSLPQATDRGVPVAEERRHTYGVRATGSAANSLYFIGELATQHGRLGDREIRAWFGSATASYVSSLGWQPRIHLELTEASGDSSANDSRSETFDPMYPTGHAFFGFADVFSGRNLRNARVGFEAQPVSKATIRVDVHNFWLSELQDGLYSPSLRLVVPPVVANRDSHVGTELDLTVRFRLSHRLTVGVGYAALFPGRFLRMHSAGGTARYPYGLVNLDF